MSYFIVDQLKTKQPVDGVEMKIISGEKMMMVFFRMEPGAVIAEHTHPHEQMGAVLEGALELTIADEKKIVGPGEAYHIASDITHSCRCLDQPTRILEVFAPPREDFLKM
jgi:quercetin dioxygenase-like cupin family protein